MMASFFLVLLSVVGQWFLRYYIVSLFVREYITLFFTSPHFIVFFFLNKTPRRILRDLLF